jgi:hypothetical protein
MNAEQVEVSEFGWTKLAETYIDSAGGFSLYPTGLSKDSAQKTTFRKRDDSQEYLVEKTVYTKNLNRLVNMCKAEAEAWEEHDEGAAGVESSEETENAEKGGSVPDTDIGASIGALAAGMKRVVR